ncbi:MAG: M23 family metallopeptidase [Candidatus Aegiribacteria sp.]|nr:M23 family metallopeptidase [Candidatus Aegiribacteria sp.]
MKRQISNNLILLAIIASFSNTGICNDPDPETPWPIGFNTSEMGISRTLMNSYGNMNGAWEDSWFHAGIDIDATTGDPDCNEVRCMDDGYVTRVDSVLIAGSDSLYQWQIIICDELGGAVPRGWAYGHLTKPLFGVNDPIAEGELVGYMNENVDTVHLHFVWTGWNNYDFSYCNPLKYLNPDPSLSEGYTWEFNPEGHNPSFQYFFLPQIFYAAWDTLSEAEVYELFGTCGFLFRHWVTRRWNARWRR